MTPGPGKYDELCTLVRERVGGLPEGGGVLVVVIGGDKGSGFAVQSDMATTMAMPDMLEHVARQMRAAGEEAIAQMYEQGVEPMQ